MARFSNPVNDGTGISIVTPFHGSFYSLTTQQALTANVTQAVMVEETDLSQGVTVEQDDNGYYTKITMENPGVYNIQFSGQIHHLGGGGVGEIFTMWFRKNGIDIPDSRTVWHVTNGRYLAPVLNIFVTADNVGDYFQLVGYPDNTQIVLEYIPATPTTPAVPSMIITVNQVA